MGRDRSGYYKKLREDRKRRGVCGQCGGILDDNDYWDCSKCRKRNNASVRSLVIRRKAEGLCPQCGGKLDSDLALCAACRIRQKSTDRRLFDKRKKLGICGTCGGPVEEGRVVCIKCSKKAAECYRTSEAIRKKASERAKQSLLRMKDMVFRAYGGWKCACCGETEPMFLSIDHINNDGNAHRKKIKSRGAPLIYRWLIKNNFPPGFQILCMNCNIGKSRNKGICPHKAKALT